MPDLFSQGSLFDAISRTAERKPVGGHGPPQAFGQAGPAATPAEPAMPEESAEQNQAAMDDIMSAGMRNDLDPISQYRLQQANLGTMSNFAAHGMGPSTSETLALHGNKLRVAAENQERLLRELEFAARVQELFGDKSGPSGTEAAIKKHDEEKRQKEQNPQSVTPSGYDPNPQPKPSGQADAPKARF